MKLFLVAPFFPPLTGGVPTLYHNICLNLPQGSVAVLARACEGAADFDRNQPFPVYRWLRFAEIDLRSIPAIVREAVGILRLARRERATHIWLGNINQCLAAMLLMPFTARGVFLYAHGEEIAHDYGGRLYRWCKARFLAQVPQVVAVSGFTRDQLVARGVPPERIRVIPNAVDTERFVPAGKDPLLVEKWGLAGKKVILTLARMELRKGHDQVIRGLPEILRRVPQAHYLICGTGEEEARLRKMASEMDLTPHVTFGGPVPEADLVKVYNLADVFVMPNRRLDNGVNEGFGIVFLEAGACGIPVVGGRDGGVPDAIRDGETGFLVDGGCTGEIAEAVCRLLTDKGLAESMGKRGREQAVSMNYGRLTEMLCGFVGD